MALKAPSIVIDIWKAWSEFRFKAPDLEFDLIVSQSIHANSLLLRGHRPYFSSVLAQNQVNYLIDLVHPTACRLYTYDEFCQYVGEIISFLDYYSLIACIPNIWKGIIRTNPITMVIDPQYTVDTLASRPNFTRFIYWSLIEQRYPTPPVATTKLIWEWELGISISDDSWRSLYSSFKAHVKPAKLRLFQYRLYTRTLTTSVRRNKWDHIVSPLCTFCNSQPETLLHLFTECVVISRLWTCVHRMCNYFLEIDVNFDPELIMLNSYKGKSSQLINFLIVVVKQFIYASKCLQTSPDFNQCMSRIATWYNIDKYIVYDTCNTKQIKKFHHK